MEPHPVTPLIRYPPSNNSLLSSGNTKKAITYEPRTEAISPAINDDILTVENSTSKSTKDEQTLLVEKLKKVEAEILQTGLQMTRLQLQQQQLTSSAAKNDDDQENVCDTKQLSIAKLVYHENRAKAQRAHSKLDSFGCSNRDLPLYNQPSDNAIYHLNAAKFSNSFKTRLIACFRDRLQTRLKLEESVSAEYDRRMEKWLKSIEQDDSQPNQRMLDAKTREFFEKQFPELKKARESGERFSRVGQRVARSDAELDELLDGIAEREDQDKKVKSYAVIPPMLEEMRSRKPKYINQNGYIEDIKAEYEKYQLLNTWTDEEKEIFRENYLQHPKNFGVIASVTSRKNVANCVQYYYLSKKRENYKQQLKRQQKRRTTRSLVRPVQQPAPLNCTETATNDTERANGFSSNENNSNGDIALADNASQCQTDKNETTKISALIDPAIEEQISVNNDKSSENQADHLHGNPTCCICSCEFNASNQSRNVTKSNHQLYGISVDMLKPGLRICYACRFRHVKHPCFDEPFMSPEPEIEEDEEEEQDGEGANSAMDVDRSVIQSDTHLPTAEYTESRVKDEIQVRSSPSIQTNDGADGEAPSNKNSQRTCVRDIIYQAIEMSFQEPKVSGQGTVTMISTSTATSTTTATTSTLTVTATTTATAPPPSAQQQAQHQIQPSTRQQQLQQPPPPPPPPPATSLPQVFPTQPAQNVNLAHPLNLCIRYTDTVMFRAEQPPLAHRGAKVTTVVPPTDVCEQGVLNLSKNPPQAPPVRVSVPEGPAPPPAQSPNLTGSPTSPSEMVIDESASPTSSREGD